MTATSIPHDSNHNTTRAHAPSRSMSMRTNAAVSFDSPGERHSAGDFDEVVPTYPHSSLSSRSAACVHTSSTRRDRRERERELREIQRCHKQHARSRFPPPLYASLYASPHCFFLRSIKITRTHTHTHTHTHIHTYTHIHTHTHTHHTAPAVAKVLPSQASHRGQ
jgi:hypothetical protein